jgi:hypothetical protein
VLQEVELAQSGFSTSDTLLNVITEPFAQRPYDTLRMAYGCDVCFQDAAKLISTSVKRRKADVRFKVA